MIEARCLVICSNHLGPISKTYRTYLEVQRTDTLGQLLKERHHNLLKLLRLDHIQNLLHLVQEHRLFTTIHLGPVPQQTQQHLFCERRVLFQELHNTICQLRVIQRQTLGFVQRNENTGEERFMFLFERKGEAVDNTTENLE